MQTQETTVKDFYSKKTKAKNPKFVLSYTSTAKSLEQNKKNKKDQKDKKKNFQEKKK